MNLSQYDLYTDNQVSFIHKNMYLCPVMQKTSFLPSRNLPMGKREKEHKKNLDKHDRFH